MQDLGNIGEFVGGIAVLLTFIFLALQIRQNSRMIKAQILQSFADNTISGNLSWVTDPDIRQTMMKVNKEEQLNDEENLIQWGFVYSVLRLWENQYTRLSQLQLADESVRQVVG